MLFDTPLKAAKKRKRKRKRKQSNPSSWTVCRSKAKLDPRTLTLGIDPGKRQTHWVLAGRSANKWVVARSGFLNINPDDRIQQRLQPVRRKLLDLLGRYPSKAVVIERYIVRRAGSGNPSEPINILIGIVFDACCYLGKTLFLPTAGEHKRWLTKVYGRTPQERWPELNEHEADAASLSLWAYRHPEKRVE
jgi:hypothetical protein